jgi:hypothetical protein
MFSHNHYRKKKAADVQEIIMNSEKLGEKKNQK